jgi:Transposase DDE domain
MTNSQKIGSGGFYLPILYKKNQKQIEACLEQGEIDYADLTRWSFPDEFLCFVLESNLLKFIDHSYPNPRAKNDVPIWFLVSCQFVMHLYQTGNYQHLQFLLNAGSILTRFGFNVGTKKIGFNDKNKKTRKTVIHLDTARKFFKDTPHDEIRRWYQEDLQGWFRRQHAFEHQGIFVLDQSHLVVPDNENYQGAVKMPVDEHGQLYSNLGSLTEEQKRALVYHRCYTLSTLLNVSITQEQFHVTGYELGPGNEDELVQAEKLIPNFCRRFNGVMKLLIMDRGYIDSSFIGKIKRDHHVDTLIPLKKNMDDYQEAVALATLKNNWKLIEEEKDPQGHIIIKKEIAPVKDLELWSGLDYKMHACVTRYTIWNNHTKNYDEKYSVLISTKKYNQPKMMVAHYDLRMQTEERFRQFKHAWYITEFPSPHASLVESHVCFTLLTYSLMQLYLRREDLKHKTHQMINTLRADESLGKDAVLVYARNEYGVFDLDDYTVRVAGLQEIPRQRLVSIMQAQKEARIKRNT